MLWPDCLLVLVALLFVQQASSGNNNNNTNNEETSTISAQAQLYNGYKVIRTFVKTVEQLRYLQQFAEERDNEGRNINFWTKPHALNTTADLMVAPHVEDDVKKVLAKQGIETQTLIDNVGTILESQRDTTEESLFYSTQNVTLFFSKYQSLSNVSISSLI